jgi:excinuclease ABC subunit A
MAWVTVRGAREHNLRSVDIDLPRERLVVLCGVSGSGKSSLAFDTLHAEGQRRYLEALALHRSGVVPMLAPPRVDLVAGLPPTVALAQRVPPPSSRATVGTVTEIDALLRVLFARAGTQHCPVCGRPIVPRTADEALAVLLALPLGTRLTIESPVRVVPGVVREIEQAGFSRIRWNGAVARLDEVDRAALERETELRVVVDRIKVEPDRRSRMADSVRLAARAGGGVWVAVTDEGETVFVDRPFCVVDHLELPRLEPGLLSPFQPPGACPRCGGAGAVEGEAVCTECQGTRLSAAARAVRWRGSDLPSLQALALSELRSHLAAVDPDPIEALAVPDLVRRIDRLDRLGLAHLSLSRPAAILSSGELQRIRLARQVASPLSGVAYVLDEPAAGLDDVLVARVVELLRDLVAGGSSVIVVEHRAEVLRAADHVVEFGPGAGVAGGRIVYEGDVAGLEAGDTPTGLWLSGRRTLTPRALTGTGRQAKVTGDWIYGRPGPTVSLSLGRVVAVTGPNGSGKTALLAAVAAALRGERSRATVRGVGGLTRPVVVDRSAARAPRSNPATYVGLWDVVRELLAATPEAQVRALSASTFSLNTNGGRCEACRGTGEQTLSLGPLPDVVQPCSVCNGRRFQADVLEVRWKGSNAAELLELTVDEARTLLAGHPHLETGLRALARVGLGYVPLGQPAHTLSGGEARRLVLAKELSRAQRRGAADTAYLLDEPTTGLHPQDTERLLSLLRELADEGATVWLTTHDAALAAAADEVVSLSPDS